MEKKRLLIPALLIIGFIAGAAVQAFIFPDSAEVWYVFEILAVIAAVVLYLPGAAISSIAAIALGLALTPSTPDMTLNFGRLVIITGVIGWLSARRHTQQEHLERLLMVDRLTGMHNYSYFIERLEEERGRSDRFGSRLSLIMIDVDHFKPFNDQFGHLKGNELLKHIAGICKEQVRGVDVVSRYGGEEFAILLPNTGPAAAEEVAERIRVAVETSDFGVTSGTQTRTISAGVATYPNDADDDLQLIDRADEALYKAKADGRNRIVVFGNEPAKQEALP